MNRDEAITWLCDMCPPHSTIYTVLRHVSRTRLKHTIVLYRFMPNMEGLCRPVKLTSLVALALNLPLNAAEELVIKARTPDAGFEVVNRLSFVLHGVMNKQTGKTSEPGVPCEIGIDEHYRAGYSLNQVWL